MIALPSYHAQINDLTTFVDNIFITGGDDSNIRYLNMGNDFKNPDILLKNSGSLDCFHIANGDLFERKYDFFYESDVLIVSE